MKSEICYFTKKEMKGVKYDDDDDGDDDDDDDDGLPMQGCVMRDRGEFSSGGYSERRDCSIACRSKYNDIQYKYKYKYKYKCKCRNSEHRYCSIAYPSKYNPFN